MQNILRHFKLRRERENFKEVVDHIYKNVPYTGTNLWILVFAIFIASLGLNVNSTAVVIGAMLISPLMGPIIGLGMGVGINDLNLLKRSIFNYFFAAAVGLLTSTVYFLISPINEAHSEILARVSPNVYDVLIALFGGFAGILATCSKQKGNVIPGVAIATALMPPLCTAGYGLATLNFTYFFGAFYLFFINSVFIGLATLLTVRFLRFPLVHLQDEKAEKRKKLVVGLVVLITFIPSIYFGYSIVQENRFRQSANAFVDKEAYFENDYLLKKDIDTKTKKITLVFGGAPIVEEQIIALKLKMPYYKLDTSALIIRQGFAYLGKNDNLANSKQVDKAIDDKLAQLAYVQNAIDSIKVLDKLSAQIFQELKSLYPDVNSFLLQPAKVNTDSLKKNLTIGIIQSDEIISTSEKARIEKWLKVRMNDSTIKVYNERL